MTLLAKKFILTVQSLQFVNQWRRSVVKSEGSGSLRSSHQTKSRPKFVFVFGAENGLFGHIRLFRFWPKMNFLIFFVFVPKNVICVGPKMLCSQLNRNYVLWYRHRWLSFSAENGISFSSAFSFTAENEKCILGRPLHHCFRLHPTSMIFKHSINNPGSGQLVDALKNYFYPPFLGSTL